MPPGLYRRALASAVGSALLAALVVGGGDVALTLGQAEGVRPAQAVFFAGITLLLYLAVAVGVGLFEGVVAAAVRATHPEPILARLRRDDGADREVTAALLAALVVAVGYALAVAVLGLRLVAQPERKAVGALLLGGAAVAALPVFVLAAYPVQRLTRRIATVVPRLGAVPRALVAALVVIAAAFAAVAFVVVTRLDWRALPLAVPGAALGFAAVQLTALRFGLRLRAGLVAVLAAASILGAAVTVVATRVDERTAALLAVESGAAKTLTGFARRFFDRDGDGYATALGGGDCDDGRADVFPGARDVPDNGVDENCLGGDATRGLAPPPPDAPPSASGFRWPGNVLVILVDTVRADRLGIAGYRRAGRSLTPRLDALAEGGVWFTRAYAQSPNTPRSFPSIATSRLPSQVEWGSPIGAHNFPTVTDANVTVFEVLRDAGLHTAGFASHFYFNPERNATQGFIEFDNEGAGTIAESNTDIASPRIVPRALARVRQLAAEKKRFAMMVHLFEPHSRYMEHADFPIQGKGVEGLEEKYDYEIAFADRWIGELLDGVRAAGVADDTLVVVLSDHGEAFGKHRFGGQRLFFHGQTLYDELLRVPLIVHAKGLAPRRVDAPVMLTDVAPTLVELVGAPRPPAFLGRSLAPALTGEPLAPRVVTAELLPAPSWRHHHKMMIDEDGVSKMIYRVSDNVFELYDLGSDPDELENLVDRNPELGARMKEKVARWMESEL
jgi:choline-sulfatase